MAPIFSLLTLFSLPALSIAQSSILTATNSSGYTGYNLSVNDPGTGDTIYETASTATSNVSWPDPDVYLNASVHVGEISVLVANLTAKINLDAQVLQLLKFNAGVDLSIDKVSLLIQNVTAKVLLEARLGNLVLMIDDILKSLDLNPILVTLGQSLDNITDTVGGVLTGSSTTSTNTKRDTGIEESYELTHNILYSSNDYSGRTHTNRILAQNGDIVDRFLDNEGDVSREVVVGSVEKDMSFHGENVTATVDGKEVRRLEYVYEPFRGLMIVSYVFVDGVKVVKTQVVSEASGGGESTIGN